MGPAEPKPIREPKKFFGLVNRTEKLRLSSRLTGFSVRFSVSDFSAHPYLSHHSNFKTSHPKEIWKLNFKRLHHLSCQNNNPRPLSRLKINRRLEKILTYMNRFPTSNFMCIRTPLTPPTKLFFIRLENLLFHISIPFKSEKISYSVSILQSTSALHEI